MTDMAVALVMLMIKLRMRPCFDEATKKILRRVLVAMWDAENPARD